MSQTLTVSSPLPEKIISLPEIPFPRLKASAFTEDECPLHTEKTVGFAHHFGKSGDAMESAILAKSEFSHFIRMKLRARPT
jgi:hypothetical protein